MAEENRERWHRRKGPRRDRRGRFVPRDELEEEGVSGPEEGEGNVLTDIGNLGHALIEAAGERVENVLERVGISPSTEEEEVTEQVAEAPQAPSEPPPAPPLFRGKKQQQGPAPPPPRDTQVSQEKGNGPGIELLRTRVQQEAARADEARGRCEELDFQLFNCLTYIEALEAEIAALEAARPDTESGRRSRRTTKEEADMAGISPEKQRLIDAIRRKNRKLTEASLKRFSMEDLQAMADTMGATPGLPPSPPPPSSGAGGRSDMSTGIPAGYMPCEYCDNLVKVEKYGEHLRTAHPDKLGLPAVTSPAASAAGTGTATGRSTRPQPVIPEDFKNDPWREARDYLGSKGYTVTSEREHHADVREGRVIRVRIRDDQAKLYVSDGPEPKAEAAKVADEAVTKADEAKETAKKAEAKADEAKDKATEAKGPDTIGSIRKGLKWLADHT